MASHCDARDLRVGVFGLFHPQHLVITSLPSQPVMVSVRAHEIVLSDSRRVNLDLEGGEIRLRAGDESFASSEVRATDRIGRSADFLLTVPGKITRRFRGKLEVTCGTGELVAVVEMDLEAAVAAAVAAESLPGTVLEALKAQAIATRSYYLASPLRHEGFDFCDTTHCQFLRESPASDSPAAQATAATRGLVLLYEGAIVPALFTGSCGGRTRTLAEVGFRPGRYPYFSVSCSACLKHAVHWSVRLDAGKAAELASHTEENRLKVGRIFGWAAVPGNNFDLQADGDAVVIEGSGKGHGLGLCQLGAAGMARQRDGFREILAHYYPNTSLGTR